MSSATSHGDPIVRPIRMPAAVARWLQITIVILMPVVLVLGAVRLLATDQYLAIEYNKRGGLLTVGLVGGAGLLAVNVWQLWFDTFHRLFFAPGTWTFNASDALIRLVPEKFWFDTALSLAGLSLVSGLVATLIGWLWERRLRRS